MTTETKTQTTTFRKTTLVSGEQATEDGIMDTERGPMTYTAGDWLLSTMDGSQRWPVTQEYLDANYEEYDQVYPGKVQADGRVVVDLDAIP